MSIPKNNIVLGDTVDLDGLAGRGYRQPHPVVVVESPFAPGHYNIKQNEHFIRWLCRGLVLRGFNPIASHLYYPEFLRDDVINERILGIELGLQMAAVLRPVLITFNLRVGEDFSEGMERALEFWKTHPTPIQLIRWTPLERHESYGIVGVEVL